MGASFVTITVPGDKTRDQVKTIFREAQDQDRHENGHSYSGGIGMAEGLTFDNRTFDDFAAAHDYLDAVCEKWDAARGVTFLNEKGEPTWLIGALCAS